MEYEISKIDEQTWVLSEGFVRFFLIAGEKEALLLDTGMNVGKALEAAVRKSFLSVTARLLSLGSVLFRLSGFRVILRAALGFLILSADIFSAGIRYSRVVRSSCLVLRGTLLSLLSHSKSLKRWLISLI